MRKNYLKNNKGISLIKIILLILITILVVFLAYEIFYVDVFDIKLSEKTNPVDVFVKWTDDLKGNNELNIEKEQNVEVITPILNENEYQVPETNNFANHYYYEQLDNAGKIIYKALEDNIENMKSGNYKIDFRTQFNELLNSENGETKLNKAFQSAWNAFTYDYVDIFYIDVTKLILTTQTTTIGNFSTHKVNLSSGNYPDYFDSEISSTEDLENKVKYIENIRKQFVSQLESASDYEKIVKVHNWLVDNLEYDTTYQKSNIHNVYGAFSNKKVVCEGYARAFKYILDGLEIENVLVSGEATNSSNATESHAWNYVKIDNKWYAVDVTWDDPVITNGGTLTKEVRYQYFLRGSNHFFENHEEDGYLSQNSIKFKFPTLQKEDYVR